MDAFSIESESEVSLSLVLSFLRDNLLRRVLARTLDELPDSRKIAGQVAQGGSSGHRTVNTIFCISSLPNLREGSGGYMTPRWCVASSASRYTFLAHQ